MSRINLDATTIPDGSLLMKPLFDLIRPKRDVGALARDAGTIGYGLLTSLGISYHRQHIHS